MKSQLAIIADLQEQYNRNENTTSSSEAVIWNQLAFGVTFTAICHGKRTRGSYLNRAQCMGILTYLPKQVVANQGHRGLRAIKMPQSTIYYNQYGVKKFINCYAGESVTLSDSDDTCAGTGVSFDEAPLYVLQDIAYQLISGKFISE